MSGLFDRMLGRGKDTSANTAKERLQFVLVHDRINLPPERLAAMKAELMAVISKYVAVSNDQVEIALEQRDRSSSKIVAEIPFSKSVVWPADDDEDDDEHDQDDDEAAAPGYREDDPPTIDENMLLPEDEDDDAETRRIGNPKPDDDPFNLGD